jgi:hypothetical protein
MKPVTDVLGRIELTCGTILPDVFFSAFNEFKLFFCELPSECVVIKITHMKTIETKHHGVGKIISTSVVFSGSHGHISSGW